MSPAFQAVVFISFLVLSSSADTNQVNLTLLMDIIQCSDKYYQFRNFPILSAHRTLFEIQDFIIDLQNTFQRPLYILSRNTENFYLRYHIYRQSLLLVFFRGIADAVFERADTLTRGRRLMCVLFILTRPPMTYHEIREIMAHAWRSYYMHAVLLYRDIRGRDHLITFRSYPEFKIKRLKFTYRVSDIYASRGNATLEGYKIRSPVKFDIPRVFKVTDYNGCAQIKGYGYQLFMAFVKYKNATFEEYVIPNTSNSADRRDIFHLLSVGEIEISLHPHAMRELEKVGSTYPIRLNDLCIMIPMANEIPSYMYLYRPLHYTAWILVVFATIYVAFALMWILPKSVHGQRKEFGLSLLQAIGYMLNMPTCGYYYKVTWKYFLTYNGVWILGFLVTTWYCALLESFLTSTIFGSQIDTMDDIIASGLKILVTDNDIEDAKKMTDLPKEFRDLFVGTTVDSLAEHRNGLNTTYAYAVTVDRWNFLTLQQQYSKRPIFRLSHICFMKHHLAYPLVYDSGLQYSMNSFILYAQQSGLTEYWARVDFKYAVREGYLKLRMDSYEVGPLHGENMRLAWEVLGIGLGVSAAVFFVEFLQLIKWSKCLWILLERGVRTANIRKMNIWYWR